MILRRMLAIWISKATCVVCKLAGKQEDDRAWNSISRILLNLW